MLNAKKGQIFSLDFLLSLMLIIVIIGILLNSLELKSYAVKQNFQKQYLYNLAYTASQRLVSSYELACELEDESGNKIDGFTLLNCINPNKTITKEALGIPENFKCNISGINVQKCNDNIAADEEKISIKRKVFIADKLTKKEFYGCMQGNICNYEKEIVVTLAYGD